MAGRTRLGRYTWASLAACGIIGALCLVGVFPRHASAEELHPGAKLIQLTTDGKSRGWFWSTRGNRIAYLRDLSNTQAQLRVMNADGSDDRDVSPVGNPFFIQWSWAGDRLSYEFANQRDPNSQGGAFIYDLATDQSIPISENSTYGALSGFRPRPPGGRGGGGSQSNRRPPRRESQSRRPGLNSFGGADGPIWSADDKYVAYSLLGPGGDDELWVAETATGQFQRLLSQRGSVAKPWWSPSVPGQLVVGVQASGRYHDAAVVNPDGSGLTMVTNIGSDSIEQDDPYWSPTGEWVSYTSDAEMTEDEQRKRRTDVWIARPDGSEHRNLTQATSNSTEEQLRIWRTRWAWDGKSIMGNGERFDRQGRGIRTIYLINVDGGYEIIQTSDPETTGQSESSFETEWSHDSTRIAMLVRRNRVRNWTTLPENEDTRTGVAIYDIATRTMHDVLFFSEDRDRKQISGQLSWSPDGRSILLSVEDIISVDEGITQPDVYRLELPPELVSPKAAQFNGPPFGVGAGVGTITVAQAPESDSPDPVQTAAPVPAPVVAQTANNEIITIVEPSHLTVTEIQPLIPAEYAQYIKADTSRNLFVFVGPRSVHAALIADLGVIDFPAEHIVVDFLAIETSDALTRELGLDWAYTEGRFSFFAPEGLGVSNFTPGFQTAPPVINQEFPSLSNSDIADRFNVDNVADLLVGGLGTFPGTGQALFSGVGKLPREFYARLNALQQDGEITIVANPRTVATSGKKSVIQIRRVVNFFFTEGVNLSTGTPNVRKADVTATTEGTITPTLLADGKVHMTVDVSVGTVTFGAEDLPQQTDRKATTEVTVAPGDTIIIGGLRQQEHKIIETKTPVLGSIPYLGKLFSKTRRENQHSVLTILITPRIMGQEVSPTKLPDPGWTEYELDDRYKVPIINNGTLDKKKKKRFLRGSKPNSTGKE